MQRELRIMLHTNVESIESAFSFMLSRYTDIRKRTPVLHNIYVHMHPILESSFEEENPVVVLHTGTSSTSTCLRVDDGGIPLSAKRRARAVLVRS